MKNLTLYILTLLVASCSSKNYNSTSLTNNIGIKFPSKPNINKDSNMDFYSKEMGDCSYKVKVYNDAMPDYLTYINPIFNNIPKPTDDQILFYNMLEDRNKRIKRAFIDSAIQKTLPIKEKELNMNYSMLIENKDLTASFTEYHLDFKTIKSVFLLEKDKLIIIVQTSPFSPNESNPCYSIFETLTMNDNLIDMNFKKNINPVTGLPFIGSEFSPPLGKVRTIYEDSPPKPYSEFEKSLKKAFWEVEKNDKAVLFTIEDEKVIIKE